MAKAPPIAVTLLLVKLKSGLRSARNVLGRVAVFRLGMFLVKAAWFSLQLSGAARKPARALVSLPDRGSRTLDLSSVSVAKAELGAAAAQTKELWYELRTTRHSPAIESIQDLLSVVLLSTRARSFSLNLAGDTASAFEELALTSLAGGEGLGGADPLAFLADFNSRPLAEALGKPFYLSEIGPNDYLKRATNGRKAVLVSLSGENPADCLRQLLGDTRKFFGEDGGELFALVERCPLPEGENLPDGVAIQPVEVLGFTNLERLALARNVDILVTDFAPYILSALTRDGTIICPVLAAAGRKVAAFEVSTVRDGQRSLEQLSASDLAPARQGSLPGVQSGEGR